MSVTTRPRDVVEQLDGMYPLYRFGNWVIDDDA